MNNKPPSIMCGIRDDTSYKTKVLKIIECSDSQYWYSDMIGKYVPYVRAHPNEDIYISREPEGYVNIVKMCDAELLEIEADSYQCY